MQITPEQIPQLVAEHKAAVEAVDKVLERKRQIAQLFDRMDELIAGSDIVAAMGCLAQAQKIEYGMQIEGLEEKRKQHQSIVDQLDKQVLTSGSMPRMPAMNPAQRGGPGRR